MISRSVGVRSVWRRAKLGGISIAHWSSRICATTASSARSARTKTSVSVIPTSPLVVLAIDDDGSADLVVPALLATVEGGPDEPDRTAEGGDDPADVAEDRLADPDRLQGCLVRHPDVDDSHARRRALAPEEDEVEEARTEAEPLVALSHRLDLGLVLGCDRRAAAEHEQEDDRARDADDQAVDEVGEEPDPEAGVG